MKKIRMAVVGVGYLGKFHANKCANSARSEFIAVCDINKELASKIASKYNVDAFENYHDLIGKVDAVTIVTPTIYHHEIALFFLKNGIHVLLEKPMTVTLKEADELIKVSKEKGVVLQVGHLERFNSVVRGALPLLEKPLFIESLRISSFKPRGIDVSVVLDLMIHDIDIIQFLINAKVKNIRANGAPVLTSRIDIANARLEFENGAVANVTASRVSLKSQRIIRIFQHNSYLSLDLGEKRLAIHKKGDTEMFPGFPEIVSEEEDYEVGDALQEQMDAFLAAIVENKPPLVSGDDGRSALENALKITEIMHEHNRQLFSE